MKPDNIKLITHVFALLIFFFSFSAAALAADATAEVSAALIKYKTPPGGAPYREVAKAIGARAGKTVLCDRSVGNNTIEIEIANETIEAAIKKLCAIRAPRRKMVYRVESGQYIIGIPRRLHVDSDQYFDITLSYPAGKKIKTLLEKKYAGILRGISLHDEDFEMSIYFKDPGFTTTQYMEIVNFVRANDGPEN